MSAKRGNPTHHIEMRQKTENEVGRYNNVVAEHNRLKLRGDWEASSSKRVANTTLVQAMNLAQARRDDVLAIRRQRLADLLAREREEHEGLLQNLVVTDDQRRERLMQKARDLRVQREELRQQASNSRKDELFRNQAAVIREAESRIKVLATADQRDTQLIERQRLKAEQDAEDRFFAEQAMALQKSQAARAQADLEKLHVRAKKMKEDLDLQATRNVQRQEENRARDQELEATFQETIQKGMAKESAQEAARKQRQLDIAAETRARNEELRVQKLEEAARHREEEKRELEDLLAKIAEDEGMEQKKKKKAREDAHARLREIEEQMNAVAASETALDRLWQEEADRQWAKREEEWKRNEASRQALMADVFKSRKDQIVALRAKEQQDAEMREAERTGTLKGAPPAGGSVLLQDHETPDERRRKALEYQAYLKMQVDRKAALKEQEKAAKRGELTSAQEEELRYQAKIREELAKLEASKPKNYAHIPLTSTRRGL